MTETPPSTPQPVAAQPDLTAIKIPLLISGIFNCIGALSWASTCFLFFMGIPLAVLAVFEFMQFAKLSKPDVNPPEHKDRTKVIAICEICSILCLSLAGLICGIIVMMNLTKMDKPRA